MIGIASFVWLIICLLIVFFSCFYVGYLLRTYFLKNLDDYIFSLDYFIGQILLSLFTILVSLFIGGNLKTVLFLIVAIYLATRGFIILIPQFVNTKVKLDSHQKFLITFISVVLISYLLKSFVTPFTYDDVVYHFPVVKEISKGLVSLPLLQTSPMLDFYKPFAIFYGSLPYSSESFASFLFTISLNNRNSVQLLYLFNFVVFLLFVYQSLKKNYFILSKTTRLVILFLLVTLLDVALNISTGYIDINIAIYQFLSLILVTRAILDKNIGFLYISGLAFGYTLGMKYTAIYALPVMAINYLYFLIYKNDTGFIRKTINLCALLLIGGGFWYIVNFVNHLNPVYPLYFGHSGISEQTYKLIIDTQTKIGSDVTFINLIKFVSATFLDQWVILLSVPLIIFAMFNSKHNLTTFNLIICGITVFLIDFFFGSQISRFSIILPIAVVFIVGSVINKSTLLGNILFIVVIATILFNAMQHSIWKANLDDAYNLIIGNSQLIEKEKLGCSYDIVRFLKDSKNKNSSTLNFWDPYASVFYQDSDVFRSFRGVNNPKSFILPDDVKYLFVNDQMKKSFMSSVEFHRDIDPVGLSLIEDKIRGELEFKSGNCMLYKIRRGSI